MKKLAIVVAALCVMRMGASAQVLQSAGVQNTLWTGFGGPLGISTFHYYGFIDTFQVRVDIGIFTIDGMINWGALSRWDGDDDLAGFSFENTERSALAFHYYGEGGDRRYNMMLDGRPKYYSNRSNGYWNVRSDSYYINFLVHPFTGFDAGIGTKLNWSVGPAPGYGAWVWESDAHVRTGGFSTAYDDRHGIIASETRWDVWQNGGEYRFTPDAPGTFDVVGFVPLANKYAKTAIGARYRYKELFQVGAAFPSGMDFRHFRMNLGFEITPVDFLTLAAAYEGLFQRDGNFYTGATVAFASRTFILDAYFGWDGIDNKGDDMAYTTGAMFTINLSRLNMMIRPEAGINWFQNSDYTPAFYTGGLFRWTFVERFTLGAWTSFAWGSRDRRWKDRNLIVNSNYNRTKNWTGGFIWDIRPVFTFQLAERHALSTDFDFETRRAFDGKVRNAWSTGFYWTYKYGI